eukprot:18033-Pyramimonas_sp.AAC.2
MHTSTLPSRSTPVRVTREARRDWCVTGTRRVCVWRQVSESTIEENIAKKADQKRILDFLAIQSGGFNTDALADKDKDSADKDSMLVGAGGDAAMLAAKSGFANANVVDLKAEEARSKAKKWDDGELAEALRNVEDEADRDAAKMAEQETAAEML